MSGSASKTKRGRGWGRPGPLAGRGAAIPGRAGERRRTGADRPGRVVCAESDHLPRLFYRVLLCHGHRENGTKGFIVADHAHLLDSSDRARLEQPQHPRQQGDARTRPAPPLAERAPDSRLRARAGPGRGTVVPLKRPLANLTKPRLVHIQRRPGLSTGFLTETLLNYTTPLSAPRSKLSRGYLKKGAGRSPGQAMRQEYGHREVDDVLRGRSFVFAVLGGVPVRCPARRRPARPPIGPSARCRQSRKTGWRRAVRGHPQAPGAARRPAAGREQPWSNQSRDSRGGSVPDWASNSLALS